MFGEPVGRSGMLFWNSKIDLGGNVVLFGLVKTILDPFWKDFNAKSGPKFVLNEEK